MLASGNLVLQEDNVKILIVKSQYPFHVKVRGQKPWVSKTNLSCRKLNINAAISFSNLKIFFSIIKMKKLSSCVPKLLTTLETFSNGWSRSRDPKKTSPFSSFADFIFEKRNLADGFN